MLTQGLHKSSSSKLFLIAIYNEDTGENSNVPWLKGDQLLEQMCVYVSICSYRHAHIFSIYFVFYIVHIYIYIILCDTLK